MARQTQFRFKREDPQSASIPHKFVISLSTTTNPRWRYWPTCRPPNPKNLRTIKVIRPSVCSSFNCECISPSGQSGARHCQRHFCPSLFPYGKGRIRSFISILLRRISSAVPVIAHTSCTDATIPFRIRGIFAVADSRPLVLLYRRRVSLTSYLSKTFIYRGVTNQGQVYQVLYLDLLGWERFLLVELPRMAPAALCRFSYHYDKIRIWPIAIVILLY